MELFKASRQWAERPADERFWNVNELDEVVKNYRQAARTARVPYALLDAVVDGNEVKLRNKQTENASRMTHWAFGQLASRASAPASYLRELPASLAADCINHGLSLRDDGDEAQLMFHANGSLIARSVTSERYDRIWNADITPYLLRFAERGWRTPPAYGNSADPRARVATEADCIGAVSIINPGMLISPAGVYCSDHDMFVFMVDPSKQIADGSEGGLYRGFFCWNSEVGAASFGVQCFLFRVVCGNHIVWEARDVKTVRIRHVGNASYRFGEEIQGMVSRYANSSASDEEAKIASAKRVMLGKTKDEALARIFGMRILSKSAAESAYQTGLENADTDGDPKTVYGYVNAMTRYSQLTKYADERVALDRAANKVLQIAF